MFSLSGQQWPSCRGRPVPRASRRRRPTRRERSWPAANPRKRPGRRPFLTGIAPSEARGPRAPDRRGEGAAGVPAIRVKRTPQGDTRKSTLFRNVHMKRIPRIQSRSRSRRRPSSRIRILFSRRFSCYDLTVECLVRPTVASRHGTHIKQSVCRIPGSVTPHSESAGGRRAQRRITPCGGYGSTPRTLGLSGWALSPTRRSRRVSSSGSQ